MTEFGNQALLQRIRQIVSDQPALLLLMIDHHGPAVNADGHFGDLLGIFGNGRQFFDAPRQIVAEIADRTAAKRQAVDGRQACAQVLLQQFERIGAALDDPAVALDPGGIAVGLQGGNRRVSQNIVTVLAAMGLRAIQEHRPRQMGNRSE